MKRIAIIGAGYTGLAIAKRMIEKDNGNIKVHIYEKESETGGLVRAVNKFNNNLDLHYRHIFKSDKYVIELAKQFGIEIMWPKTKMGYYTQNKLFEFGTPISLLTFKPLSYINKIRFGLAILDLKLKKNVKELEKYTAEEYIVKHYGSDVYKEVWEPLLIGKFGDKKDKVSMAWLWGKICLRGSSIGIDGERLGYIKGSYKILTDKLEAFLKYNGCNIYLNYNIDKIKKINNKYVINNKEYDLVISTLPNVVTAEICKEILDSSKVKLEQVEYTAAKTLMIISNKSLSKYYWINIGDKDIPFGGIIEHTNMIPTDEYDGNHIIYISNYMYKDNDIYKYNGEQLLEKYLPYLNKINGDFTKDNIKEVVLTNAEYAQPIIETNYSEKKAKFKIDNELLYIANMEQIYPEDRGMNYAIRLGYKVADSIINELKSKGDI